MLDHPERTVMVVLTLMVMAMAVAVVEATVVRAMEGINTNDRLLQLIP